MSPRQSLQRPILIPFIGGLGNQLFQLCAGLFIQRHNSYRVVFTDRLLTLTPNSLAERRRFMLRSLIFPEETSRPSRLYLSFATFLSRFEFQNYIRESTPANDTLARVTPETRLLLGFFQKNSYVSLVWDELIFRFAASLEFSQLMTQEKHSSIVIHIRRGDYLDPKTRKHHGFTSNQYYETACQILSDITGCSSYLVVSDDIVGAEIQFQTSNFFSQRRVQFVSGLNEMETLSLMSSARGVVASNSSFSWWGARLCWAFGPGVVAVPRPWLAQDGPVDSQLHPFDSRWFVVDRPIA